MGQKAYWPLPFDNSPEFNYACVPVPKDETHTAAFWGAMLSLTHWYNWERDDSQAAKYAADLWKDIFDMIVIGDDCTKCPGWWLVKDPSVSGQSTGVNTVFLASQCGCDAPGAGMTYGVCTRGDLEIEGLQAVYGVQAGSLDGVGGIIRYAYYQATQVVALPIVTITVTDCLGNETAYNFSTDLGQVNDVEAKKVKISTNFNFVAIYQTCGHVLCLEA